MRPARYRTTFALLASLCLVLGLSAGCGGDDDDDTADGTDDGNDGADGADGADDGTPGQDAAVSDCEPVNGTNLALELVGQGFDQPVLATAPGGDPRLFVVSKHGTISIIKNGQVLDDPFLDIDKRVVSEQADNEQGLLGMAFHPQFADNGRFYVYYTAPGTGANQDRVSEFRVSARNPDLADPESEREVLNIVDPENNHNGGMIAFGPDDYLYIGLGDGGGGGDQHGDVGNGQDKTTLLGDMLRIDVEAEPYGIPSSNPYASSKNGERPEIFLSGLRNPWRWSFDRQNGDLYLADVGQGSWEEVNVLPAGQQAGLNLGWRVMEGMECFQADECDTNGLTLPVAVYPNPPDPGVSAVVGGYVYRGTCFPDIQGWYFYGDYLSEQVWKFVYAGGQATEAAEVTSDIDPEGLLSGLSSFGQDGFGELYAVSLRTGEVFHIVAGP